MKRRVLFVLLCAALAAGAFALGRGTVRAGGQVIPSAGTPEGKTQYWEYQSQPFYDSDAYTCVKLDYTGSMDDGCISGAGAELITSWEDYCALVRRVADWPGQTAYPRLLYGQDMAKYPALSRAGRVTEEFFEGYCLAAVDWYAEGALAALSRLDEARESGGTLHCTLTRDCFSSTANSGCGTLFLIPVSRDCTEIRVQERQGAWLES